MDDQTCGTCRFCSYERCCAHPPRPNGDGSEFPLVELDDWCGEWKPQPRNDVATTWISVNDRLPEMRDAEGAFRYSDPVLVYVIQRGGSRKVKIGRLQHWLPGEPRWFGVHTMVPTHWCPIPDLPGGE